MFAPRSTRFSAQSARGSASADTGSSHGRHPGTPGALHSDSSESISPANLIATVKSGDWISLDGGEGFVINRKVEMNAAGEGVYEQHPKMAKFMSWVELGVFSQIP